MKKLGGAFALILAAASLAIGAELVKNTLQNLQSAYNGESNAGAKYLEFAKQADREGYGQAASLFRAAAASEQIHRTCEAAVMKEMGAVPHAEHQPAAGQLYEAEPRRVCRQKRGSIRSLYDVSEVRPPGAQRRKQSRGTMLCLCAGGRG